MRSAESVPEAHRALSMEKPLSHRSDRGTLVIGPDAQNRPKKEYGATSPKTDSPAVPPRTVKETRRDAVSLGKI